MISVNNVSKAFGTKKVLDEISLDVSKGQSLAVIGGSGSGKTVLLKCILGLIPHDSGDIIIDGQKITAHNHAQIMGRVGMLFQGGGLFDSLTIWENVAFRMIWGNQRTSQKKAYETAVEKLHRVGLGSDVVDLYPAELSGGMQKRVSLARAIACNPEIIFFDEPTTGLDPIMSAVINELIREVVSDMKATAITITHDMASVRAIADQVAFLYEGRIQWHGSIDDLFSIKDPYITQFINGQTNGPISVLR